MWYNKFMEKLKKREAFTVKKTKIVAMITAFCLLFSGCSFFEKPDDGIIEKEEGLSADIQITPEIPEEPVEEPVE